jgi:hypothetical protein
VPSCNRLLEVLAFRLACLGPRNHSDRTMLMAGGSPRQSVLALRAPAGLWAEEVGRVTATKTQGFEQDA